ncbi:hypothetical protein Hypma_008559 [Hypsizygus marmoreus]|uniref:Uncharacterized protein n=1 Tax=Hypsizygus marmoreus TaxID=39966 RepID=A0A369JSK7_HYPMA|nr:hypothetical protein Hypma_008559 [Hypsizygus marmoreus]
MRKLISSSVLSNSGDNKPAAMIRPSCIFSERPTTSAYTGYTNIAAVSNDADISNDDPSASLTESAITQHLWAREID